MSQVAGKSLLDLMWEHLDRLMDELMVPAHEGGEEELAELRGEARGWAEAIAITTDPYAPLVDAVREEAMERWETREAEALRGLADRLEKALDQEETKLRKANERSSIHQQIKREISEERAARREARRVRRSRNG